jgi:hypothetical protein
VKWILIVLLALFLMLTLFLGSLIIWNINKKPVDEKHSFVEQKSFPTPPPTNYADYEPPPFPYPTIDLNSLGKELHFKETDRFYVVLDINKYPLKNLKCKPEGIIEYISNNSEVYGPDNYMISYETVKPGYCLLSNGDFSVRIVVDSPK